MALTEAQRVEIRRYLGWQARYWQMDSQLEQAMNAMDTLPETLTSIGLRLAELAVLETSITSARGRLKALAVGSITLSGPGEISALRSEGRRITASLAATLGVPVKPGAVFGGGSGSNYIRQG